MFCDKHINSLEKKKQNIGGSMQSLNNLAGLSQGVLHYTGGSVCVSVCVCVLIAGSFTLAQCVIRCDPVFLLNLLGLCVCVCVCVCLCACACSSACLCIVSMFPACTVTTWWELARHKVHPSTHQHILNSQEVHELNS